MGSKVFIAHTSADQALADVLCKSIEDAGYEVVHAEKILVGESLIEEAQKVLATGGPVVICATARAAGTRWAHKIANAARMNERGRVFVMQMEQEAFIEPLALGEAIGAYWEDPGKALAKLINALQRYFPLRTSRPLESSPHDAERQYRQHLLDACDVIDLASLPEGERRLTPGKTDLRQLYLPLQCRVELGSKQELIQEELCRLEERRNAAWRRTAQHRDAVDERVPVAERLAHSKRLVVLGDPGTGKSTLIRWIATAYLLRMEQSPEQKTLPGMSSLPAKNWLPIVIRCRDLTPETIAGSFDDMLRHLLRKAEHTDENVELLRRLLRQKLATDEAILLIDGLDEISAPSARVRFYQQLEKIQIAFPSAPIVVTSRIVGYREMGQRIGRGFEHVTVCGLLPEDKNKFVRRWCAMVEPPERVAAATEELIRDIHSSDRIERLTASPILLTTIALVKRKMGILIKKRASLYWEAVQVLLDWRRAETEDSLDADEILPQLQFIAYAMCDRGVQRLRRDEVLSLLTQLRAEYPNLHAIHNRSPEKFLAQLLRQTPLLFEPGEVRHGGRRVPVYEFRHLTFQEYLAALALVDRCFPSAPVCSLAKNVAPLAGRTGQATGGGATWQEVLPLCVTACSNDDVDDVLNAILEPAPGENSQMTARARVIIAMKCLLDEPHVSTRMAHRVLEALARSSQGPGSYDKELSDLYRRIARSRWNFAAKRALFAEFRRCAPEDRPSIAAYYVDLLPLPDEVTRQQQCQQQLKRLSSDDESEVFDAILSLTYLAEDPFREEPPTFVNALLPVLERGGFLSHAAAQQLTDWADASDGEGPWSLTPEQIRRILRVIEVEDADLGCIEDLVQLLGWSGARKATPQVIAKLRHPNDLIRNRAAAALGHFKDTRAVEPLIQALEDPSPWVRRAAAEALGYFSFEAVAGALCRSATDPHESVRSSAGYALCSVIRSTTRRTQRRSRKASPGSKPVGTKPDLTAAIDIMSGVLSERAAFSVDYFTLRTRIVEILGELKPPRAVPHLICELEAQLRFLSDSIHTVGVEPGSEIRDWVHRSESISSLIIFALGEIGDARAVTVLRTTQNVNSNAPNLRCKATNALSKILGQRAEL
jgi:HEAT repeat protein